MPRGRDECWQEVDRNLDDASGKRHPRVTCKHCGTTWTSNEKGRVIEHLQRCTELPETLWRSYQPNRLDPGLPTAQDLQIQQRVRTRGIGAISTSEQDIATAACAQWINAAGLNANITEHPAFRTFVQTLRPAFKVPNRRQLSQALVDAPLMFIAHLADPQERLRRPTLLDGGEEMQSRSLQAFVLRYCENDTTRAANLLGMLSLLRVKQGPFSNDMVWMASDQMPAMQWWQNFWLAEHRAISELCMLALAIAPTQGESMNRNWSPHSFTHTLKRYQIDPGVSTRLISAFWALRIRHGWVDEGAATDAGDLLDSDAYFNDDDAFVPVTG